MINFKTTPLPGVMLIEPQVFRDERGFFLETYHEERYRAAGIDATFVQDNHSRSEKGTLRGLHAQLGRPQGKLVRVIEGEIFDVALDIRIGSPTFGISFGARISADNFHQIFIPPGFAHGFYVLSEIAQVEYKCTDFYDPSTEVTIKWDDPELGIEWPIDPAAPLILSRKDEGAGSLRELLDRLNLMRKQGRP